MSHKVLAMMTLLAALLIGSASFAQGGIAEHRGTPDNLLPGSRTVIGPQNELLTAGSQAMVAGRWADGVRLTLLGLERPGLTDHMRSGALSNLCGGYAALNQPDLAIEYCTESIELNERNWRAWSNRSYAYWMKDDYASAGEDLERATSINERARQLFVIRGMLNEAGLRPRIQMEDRQ